MNENPHVDSTSSAVVARRRPVPSDLYGGRLKDCLLLDLEVAGITDLTERLRSIRFRSLDLIDFGWAAGQDVMLDVPGEGSVRRRYSIRRADPVAGTLDIEVVLHGGGPFGTWAASAKAGDRIDGIGPRGSAIPGASAAHHYFVGDDSALPVIFAVIEAMPAGSSATAVICAEDATSTRASVPPPASAATVEVIWTSPDALDEEVRNATLPSGTAAYVYGERSLVRSTVDLITACGVRRDAISAKAYWRRDEANAAHGEPGRD